MQRFRRFVFFGNHQLNVFWFRNRQPSGGVDQPPPEGEMGLPNSPQPWMWPNQAQDCVACSSYNLVLGWIGKCLFLQFFVVDQGKNIVYIFHAGLELHAERKIAPRGALACLSTAFRNGLLFTIHPNLMQSKSFFTGPNQRPSRFCAQTSRKDTTCSFFSKNILATQIQDNSPGRAGKLGSERF